MFVSVSGNAQECWVDFTEVNCAGAGQAAALRAGWPGNIWTPGGRGGRGGRGSPRTAADSRQRHHRAAWKLHAGRRAHKSRAINQPEKSRGNQLYAGHNSLEKQHGAVTVLTYEFSTLRSTRPYRLPSAEEAALMSALRLPNPQILRNAVVFVF